MYIRRVLGISMNLRIFAVVVGISLIGLSCGPRGRVQLGETKNHHEFILEASPAAAYVTDIEQGDPVVGGVHAKDVASGVKAASDAMQKRLLGDRKIGKLCDWVIDHLGPGGEVPEGEVIDFARMHFGIVEPNPHFIVLGLSHDQEVGDAVQRSVSRFLSVGNYNRWGASIRARSGIWVIVIGLSWRYLALQPIPREMSVRSPITIKGQLDESHVQPVLVVETPGGEVKRVMLGEGREFHVDLPTPAKGSYRLEILARSERGEEVVANFVVYAGEHAPSKFIAPKVQLVPEKLPEEVEAKLLDYIQEERRKVGLGPIERSRQLDAVARAHAIDMRDRRSISHFSPTTGSPFDRVRAAGIASGLVLENVGRGYSSYEIHQGFRASPGHFANIIHPGINSVGIGVVTEDEGETRRAFIVAEVFVRFPREINVDEAREKVKQRLLEIRRMRGGLPFSVDPQLQAKAEEMVQRYFRDSTEDMKGIVDRFTLESLRGITGFRRVTAWMAAVGDLAQTEVFEGIGGEDADRIGIGVAQGRRAADRPTEVIIGIVMGWSK
ncbi:MAG: CAP domain-containing protein [Sandaracinaceae bacterium]|nr:CAP domain-containing protein [Sandaracinaceae bacterium]